MSRALPQSVRPVLGFLIPLLGSDRDGEALGAARAIGRKLAAVGLDLHDLAAVIAGAAPAAVDVADPPPAQPRPRRRKAPTVYVDLAPDRRAALREALADAMSDPRVRGWARYDVAALVERLDDPERRPTRNAIERAEAILAELRRTA